MSSFDDATAHDPDPQRDPDLASGFQIGEYEILATLGHGSMGTVYVARDSTGHDVAVKLFREGVGNSRILVERFRREAEATKKLRRHPYILTVYATGKEGLYHFMAMEKVAHSRTFEQLIQEHIPIEEALTVTIKLASALQYAHDHGVIHRDVKPANILVDEFGEPLLADFGVAELSDWPGFTADGALTGTPMYMAPEQARAEPVSPQSDIYSMGVVLFELLCARLPYDLPRGFNSQEVLEAVKHQRPLRARKVDRSISRDLDFVIAKALAKDPRDRYRSARDFAHDLELVKDGRPISARLASPFGWMRHLIRQHRLLSMILAGLFLVAGLSWWYVQRELASMNDRQLLNMALRRSAELAIVDSETGPSTPWEIYEQGRAELVAGRLAAAAEHFVFASRMGQLAGDFRVRAFSRLEQAHCLLLLGLLEEALDVYDVVINAPEDSPSVAHQAGVEKLLLHLAMNNPASAEALLASNRDEIENGPLGEIALHLMGQRPALNMLQEIGQLPTPLVNDGWYAEGIRLEQAGEPALNAYRTCLSLSTGEYDWPYPLAQMKVGATP